MSPDTLSHSYQLPYAMAAACRAEAWPRLRQLSMKYLEIISEETYKPKIELAEHLIHTHLGLVEVAEGNLTEARKHLLDSVSDFSNFKLREAGPNLLLAKRMLEAGEKDVVLEFLAKTDHFWIGRLNLGHTAGWEKEITEGHIPDFGKNLELYLPKKPLMPKFLMIARSIEYLREQLNGKAS